MSTRFRLVKLHRKSEQQYWQREDEKRWAEPPARSWANQMSAAWEISDFPGLALSKEPPARENSRAQWTFWVGGQWCEETAQIMQAIGDQCFDTRREALQALDATWQLIASQDD